MNFIKLKTASGPTWMIAEKINFIRPTGGGEHTLISFSNGQELVAIENFDCVVDKIRISEDQSYKHLFEMTREELKRQTNILSDSLEKMTESRDRYKKDKDYLVNRVRRIRKSYEEDVCLLLDLLSYEWSKNVF